MLLTVIAFVIVLGILVLAHEFGHFIAAKRAGVMVEEFSIGFPPRILSFKRGETRYSIGAIPLGGYVKMLGELEESKSPRAFENQTPGKRLIISVAGVVMNFLLAWVLFSFVFAIGATPLTIDPDKVPGEKISTKIVIFSVADNSSAKQAGIEPGDIILRGQQKDTTTIFNNAEDLSNYTKSHRGQEISIIVDHGGREVAKSVNLPDQDAPLGVGLGEQSTVRVPWYKAPLVGLYETGQLIKMVFVFLGSLVYGIFARGEVSGDIGGPVAIYVYSGIFFRMGIIAFIQYIAALSVNLALVNFLPIPALDGGRILFILFEKIFGKKIVKEKVENIIHMIGYAILLILILLVTLKDINRYF